MDAQMDTGRHSVNVGHTQILHATEEPLPVNKSPQECGKISQIHSDAIDSIVHSVSKNSRQDLFRLCLVSKLFYFACIPWIYRHITVNFAHHHAKTLLQRVTWTWTDLNKHVRTVALRNCDEAKKYQWDLLNKALSLLSRLESLSWDSHVNIPEFLLNSIHSQHPRASIQASVNRVYAPNGFNNIWTLLSTPAIVQLTRFELTTSNNAILYHGFKTHLLQLLHNALGLQHLHLYCGPLENEGRLVFPEMQSDFQTLSLPKLVTFHIRTRSIIFTPKELDIWGLQQGWPRLQHLSVSSASHLVPFISRVPKLTYLHLNVDDGGDMNRLGNSLGVVEGLPLGIVETLIYTHSSSMNNAFVTFVDTIPWSIISKISSTLTQYQSVHQPEVVISDFSWLDFALPSAADISELRRMCPKATALCLDVDEIDLTSYGSAGVLGQLSQFTHMNSLSLYVHSPKYSAIWPSSFIYNHETLFKSAFMGILGGRKDNSKSLMVGFKQVHDWEVMHDNWNIPDWTFWLDDSGKIKQSKRDMEKDPTKEYEMLSRKHWANLSTQEAVVELKAVKDFACEEDDVFTNDIEDIDDINDIYDTEGNINDLPYYQLQNYEAGREMW